MTRELLGVTELVQKDLVFSSMLDALTEAVKATGIKVVYNYPGRPATLLVDKIKLKIPNIEIQDYLPNEFVAGAKAFGSSVAGQERSLVIYKDVGTNVACDHFYCLNHVGVNRGLVFFICDDPSAWYSQNEEDSRGIYFNAGLSILEPCDQYSAYWSMVLAYELSEIYRLPFFIRTTGRGLKENYDENKNDFTNIKPQFSNNFIDIPFDAKNKWKSIFSTVEEDREELCIKQTKISNTFNELGLNVVKGDGKLGIIASGFPATQLEKERLISDISLLKLVTVFPLPETTIINFLKGKNRVLIVEQGEPLLELLVRDLAHRNSLSIPILGKLNSFVRKVGEFRDDDLRISVDSLKVNKKSESFPRHKEIAKAPAFKKDDNYRLLLQALREAVKEVGCRPLYCGDAGQPSQIPDTSGFEDLLHMETTMGCSIPFLSGGIEAYQRKNIEIPFKGIAYVGDSNFFHSSFPGICEAASKDHPILMLLVDNQGAVSTGGQPNLGMKINKNIKQLSIRKMLEAVGVEYLEEVHVSDKANLKEKLLTGLRSNHFYVIIVHIV